MSRFTNSVKYILLLLIAAVPVFGFLDSLPVRLWDESRVAVNALEMYYNKKYLISHYEGNIDMWNTKPPLLLWMQVFFMHIFGPGEVAVRLPSSFAVFFMFLALILFCRRYFSNVALGIITVLCLVSSGAFMDFHAARSGDYDAMLTLFTTTACLFFYAFCETKETKYLYWFFTALTLGAYTKGIAALMFTPALFIYAVFSAQLKSFFTNKHFYIGLASFLVLILGFYFLRESQNPGYLKAVGDNELGGRFLEDQLNNGNDFWFYYNNFISLHFADRYLLIPCGLALGLFSTNPRLKKFTLFATLLCVTFFLIISSAKTKYSWYDTPLFPWFSLFIAIFIDHIYKLLKQSHFFAAGLKHNIIPYLFLFLIFILPYSEVWSRTYAPSERPAEQGYYQIGAYLKDATRGRVHMHNKFIVYEDYNAPLHFYVEILKHQKVKTGFKYFENIKKGDVILVSWDPTREKIKNAFKCVEIQERGNIYTLIILDTKPSAKN